MERVILEKQDLRYLKWDHSRKSSGTVGNFLKSFYLKNGEKYYCKLSNFDSEKGVIGHECVNEIIVDRLLEILGIEHLSYQLVHADIEIDGKTIETYICVSKDFKEKGENKTALDSFYVSNSLKNENHYDYCLRQGLREYVDTMLVVDYLIMNRDRHGANIEILSNRKNGRIRTAPLFDHGISLLYSCLNEKEVEEFDITKDMPCNNFIGSRSTFDNLKLIDKNSILIKNNLKESDKEIIFKDLLGIISKRQIDKIWDFIWYRWKQYEVLFNN